jgi:hypothetical protein
MIDALIVFAVPVGTLALLLLAIAGGHDDHGW